MSATVVSGSDLAACTHCLALEAQSRHAIPKELAEQAARVTQANLASSLGPSLKEVDRARVANYFWAVVRRRAVRHKAARTFAAMTVKDAIAQDLREAGWDQAAIARELDRCSA